MPTIVYLIIAACLILIAYILLRQRVKDFEDKVRTQSQSLKNILGQIDAQEKRLKDITERSAEIKGQLTNLYTDKKNEEKILAELRTQVKEENQKLSTLRIASQDLTDRLTEERHKADIKLTAEVERKRAEYKQQLEREFETLKESSKWNELLGELASLQTQIEIGQKTLAIVKQKMVDQLSEEEFNEAHSIKLSEADINDIHIILEFVKRINRKESFKKLIWTEFYQKPLQQLRKQLGADKVCGIYKITNKKDGRCYIGQSIDIGNRWTEHFKAAIGGTLTFQTNKFYQAMATEGPESFTYEILEICDRDKLNERERYWIEFYNSKELGYNTTIGG